MKRFVWLFALIQALLGCASSREWREPRAAVGSSRSGRRHPRQERIAVILPVLNEIRRIGPCLRSLQLQSTAPARIIVVDGGSIDGTALWIRRAMPDDATHRPGRRGAGAGRHQWQGIRTRTRPGSGRDRYRLGAHHRCGCSFAAERNRVDPGICTTLRRSRAQRCHQPTHRRTPCWRHCIPRCSPRWCTASVFLAVQRTVSMKCRPTVSAFWSIGTCWIRWEALAISSARSARTSPSRGRSQRLGSRSDFMKPAIWSKSRCIRSAADAWQQLAAVAAGSRPIFRLERTTGIGRVRAWSRQRRSGFSPSVSLTAGAPKLLHPATGRMLIGRLGVLAGTARAYPDRPMDLLALAAGRPAGYR